MHTLLRQSLGAMAMAVVILSAGVRAEQGSDPALDGIWHQRGYGNFLSIEEETYNLYEVTSISCLKTEDGPVEDLEDDLELDSIEIADDGDRIWVLESGSAAPTTYERVQALPRACRKGGTPMTSDPEVNFDVLWHTFNEYYAFFDRRLVDWQAQYDRFRPEVSAATTDEELETIFIQMLNPLSDGHVGLTTSSGVCADNCRFGGIPDFILRLIAEHVLDSEDQSFNNDKFVESLDAIDDQRDEIIEGSLDGPVKEAANEEIEWGTINNSIGYLRIFSMGDFSPDDDASVETQAKILEAALDQVMDDFQGLRGVIVDVRENGGGYDALSLPIANRFADDKRLAFTKQAWDGDGRTESLAVHIQPQGASQFTGQVAVLTSEETGSAAEVFVIAMNALPQVTIIGDKTAGDLSDILNKELPNGWEVDLSNEVYTAANGRIYEETGIPADIPWPYLSRRDRGRNIDGAIELAVMLFEESDSACETTSDNKKGHNVVLCD